MFNKESYQKRAEDRNNGIGWSQIDTDTALAIWVAEGYTESTFQHTMLWSVDRDFTNCSGLTHRKSAPNDHYWRLVCIRDQWFFAIVD